MRKSDRRLSMNRVRKREQAPRTPNAAAQWPSARDFAEHLECVRLAGAFHGSWKVRAACGSRCFGVAKRPAGKASSAGMKWIGLALLWLSFVTDTPALAGTLAQFRTVFGAIEVELYDQDKPVTVQNFVHYVQAGRYRDSILHRCPVNPISGLSDFVVQGGGIWVANRGATNAALQLISGFSDIPNEFSVGRQFSNVYGTIAMAKRAGDTNSANSQWFFNLNNNSFLDAADSNSLFVVFGRVVRGTNVLNQFIGRSFSNGI